jgi:hypothetical protein
MDKRGVTKHFLPSVGKARIELYFTNRSLKTLFAHYLARDGRTRIYRFGRLCIGILRRGPEEPPIPPSVEAAKEELLRVAEE